LFASNIRHTLQLKERMSNCLFIRKETMKSYRREKMTVVLNGPFKKHRNGAKEGKGSMTMNYTLDKGAVI